MQPDDAADVLADTLAVVWRRIDAVPTDPIPWCFGVARRCLSNHQRGDRRRFRLVERTAALSPPPPSGDPQSVIDDSDPVLDAALGELTDSEGEIIRLWAWERLEAREIAAVLEMTPNAVSVALTRAKRKLTDRLGPATFTDRIDPPTDIPGVKARSQRIDQEGDDR